MVAIPRRINILSMLFVIIFFSMLIFTGATQKSDFYIAPVKENGNLGYSPRLVENIEVKNYNIVGKAVDYYDRMPQRVVVVGENIIETLVALGVEDRIIAAVGYGNTYYAPQEKYAARYRKVKIESGLVLNTERMLSLSPDLIISGQQLFSDKRLKSTSFWHQRNIHTFLSLNANSPFTHNHKESLDLEFEFILGLGKIFDREKEAKNIVDEMRDEIEDVSTRGREGQSPKVMIIEQLSGQFVTYDNTKLAEDICTRLGAIVPTSNSTIGLEDLLKEDPDVLFIVKSGGNPEAAADAFRNMQALRGLRCIKNKRVYGIALNYTYNSAIKTGEGIKKFAQGIYPELYQ